MDEGDSKGGTRGPRALPFGPFLLERRIAVGGSAEVFLAKPKLGTSPAARLVVKRLLPTARDGSDFDVLEREAALHQAVCHPNVVRVFGAGMVGREPYLAMEYVDGVDLYRLLRRAESEGRQVPPGLAVYVGRHVADALTAVHNAKDETGAALGIVHRDVTPSNLYLSVDGTIKLGDFGIARGKLRAKTGEPAAGLKGKFGYLAPEQVAGEPSDHRADLFSLAVLLGELLIGERIFPGSGQLAVLLAIRDVNIEPLRRAQGRLPRGLYQVLERALARDPGARYQTGEDLRSALAPFETPSAPELQQTLSEWVLWARDSSQLVRRIEGQIRDSVQRMQAVRRASGAIETSAKLENAQAARTELSHICTIDGHKTEDVPFARLVEMIATGELGGSDEVALMGAPYRKIRDIDEIARHLLPSTTATTGRLFEPGAPDYQALFRDTSMLEVLARMRTSAETGALFVERRDENDAILRKEIYLEHGRLHHVASSERAELLGEYLVRRGSIERQQLETALGLLNEYGGRLGDTLIGMHLVDAMDVFRAIRDQGRDRVAAICAWTAGGVAFYRGTSPMRVEFPLDLDLASPIMAGAILRSRNEARSLLPHGNTVLRPGPRFVTGTQRAERGTSPVSLQLVPTLVQEGATLERAIVRLMAPRSDREGRVVGENEACAALYAARLLGWVRF